MRTLSCGEALSRCWCFLLISCHVTDLSQHVLNVPLGQAVSSWYLFLPLLHMMMECPIALPASGSLLCVIASLTMDKYGLNSLLGP